MGKDQDFTATKDAESSAAEAMSATSSEKLKQIHENTEQSGGKCPLRKAGPLNSLVDMMVCARW